MNVYVESGFVITLALQQDHYPSARRLLELAQQDRLNLRIPAFSLSEPFTTIRFRANNRNRLLGDLNKEVRERSRTAPHADLAIELAGLSDRVTRVQRVHEDALERAALEIGGVCVVLPLDGETLQRASGLRSSLEMTMPDAIVLATVALDLDRRRGDGASIFVSQNLRDFDVPAIRSLLARFNCVYLGDFRNAARLAERSNQPWVNPAPVIGRVSVAPPLPIRYADGDVLPPLLTKPEAPPHDHPLHL